MSAAEKLLADALALPVGERAKLAAGLPRLDAEAPDRGYDEALAEAIAERDDAVVDGTAEYETESWEEAHARLAARLAERRKSA